MGSTFTLHLRWHGGSDNCCPHATLASWLDLDKKKTNKVYLDDSAASLLEISNLFTDGQGQLEGLRLTGDIFAGKRPVQDSHRPCNRWQNMFVGHVATICMTLCECVQLI